MSYLIQSRRLCKRLGEKKPPERCGSARAPGAGLCSAGAERRGQNHTDAPGAESVETHQRGGGAVRRTAAAGDCAPLGRMGSIIEFPAFFEMLNGLENLRLHCAYMGYHRPGAAEEALERLGLGAAGNKKVKHYSLGMRQRLGLGRAVLDPSRTAGAGRTGQRPGCCRYEAGARSAAHFVSGLGYHGVFIQSSALRSGADSRYSGHSASGKAAAGDFFERAGCTELDLY